MHRVFTRLLAAAIRRFGMDVVQRVELEDLRALELCAKHAIHVPSLVVQSLLHAGRRASFMVIGANDGVRDDSFRRLIVQYNLPGILVEPQPAAFDRLRRNYEGRSNLIFENVAVAAGGGSLTLYAFDRPEDGTAHLDVYASLDRGALERCQAFSGVTARIVELKVSAATIDEVLLRHGLSGVEICIIDTEGYDFEVIKLINFKTHRPVLIQFEHVGLSNRVRRECYQYLIDAGYCLCAGELDTYAVQA